MTAPPGKSSAPPRSHSAAGAAPSKREIKISLGTSDPAEAKLRQAQEQARWRARFRDLDRQIEPEAVAQAPQIVDSFLEAMARRNGTMANVLFGFQTEAAAKLTLQRSDGNGVLGVNRDDLRFR